MDSSSLGREATKTKPTGVQSCTSDKLRILHVYISVSTDLSVVPCDGIWADVVRVDPRRCDPVEDSCASPEASDDEARNKTLVIRHPRVPAHQWAGVPEARVRKNELQYCL